MTTIEDRVSRLEREHDQIIERLSQLPTEAQFRNLLDAFRRELQTEMRSQFRWLMGIGFGLVALIVSVLLSQLGLIYWTSAHFVARP